LTYFLLQQKLDGANAIVETQSVFVATELESALALERIRPDASGGDEIKGDI
jgi:hypothetical protein